MNPKGPSATTHRWARTMRFTRLIPIVILLSLALAGAGCSENDGELLQPGERVGDCEVTSHESHTEFVRVAFSCPAGSRRVELSSNDGGSCTYCSRLHRVQPAPQSEVDEELLGALTEHLRKRDADPCAVPRWGRRVPMGPVPGEAPIPTALSLIGFLASLGLFVLLTGAHLRSHPDERRGLLALGAVAAGWSAAVLLLPSSWIPTSWVTLLQEGSTATTLVGLHGGNVHTGPAFALWKWCFGASGPLAILALVKLNILLTGVSLLLLLGVARHLLGSFPRAALFALSIALLPPVRLAATSESPGALIGLLSLTAAPALIPLLRKRERASRMDWAIVGSLLAAAVQLFFIRPECALPFAVATALATMRALGTRSPWVAVRTLLTRKPLVRYTLVAFVLVLGAGALYLINTHLLAARTDSLQCVSETLHPGARSHRHVLQLLAGTMSVGAAALMALAGLWSLLRPLRTSALPLSVLVLTSLYITAATGPWVMVRYATHLYVFVALSVLLSFGQLLSRPLRGQTAIAWAVALLALLPTLPATFGSIWTDEQRPDVSFLTDLDRNLQREARFLLDALRDDPSALFVTVSSSEAYGADRARGCDYVLFGGSHRSPRREPRQGRGPRALLERLGGCSPRHILYRGLDGHIVDGGACLVEAEGRTIRERRFASRPYSLTSEFGTLKSELHLGFWELHPAENPGGEGR